MGDKFTVKDNKIVFDTIFYVTVIVEQGVYCAVIRLGNIMGIKCPCTIKSKYNRIGELTTKL